MSRDSNYVTSFRRIAILVFFAFFSLVQISAQKILDQKIDFIIEDLSKLEALMLLEEAAEVVVTYDKSIFDPNTLISLHVIDVPVSFILKKIIGNQDLQFLAEENKIIIRTAAFEPYSVSGYVRDRVSQEGVGEALVTNMQSGNSVRTNTNGFYSIEVENASTQFKISHHDYTENKISIHQKTQALVFELSPSHGDSSHSFIPTNIALIHCPSAINPIEQRYHSSTEFSALSDLNRRLSSQSMGENMTTSIHRGGRDHHTSVFLDGIKILQPYHSLNRYDVLHSRMIKQGVAYMRYLPANFSGSSSSAMDIKTRDGSPTRYGVDVGINNILGNMIVDIPIIKNKLGTIISYRQNHNDPWRQDWMSPTKNNRLDNRTRYDFMDFQGKLWWTIKKKHQIIFSHFQQQDHLTNRFHQDSVMSYGNFNQEIDVRFNRDMAMDGRRSISAINWRFDANPKLQMNTLFSYSYYRNFNKAATLGKGIDNNSDSLFVASIQQDLSLLTQWEGQLNIDYYHSAKQHFQVGVLVDIRALSPGILIYNQNLSSTKLSEPSYFNESIQSFHKEIRFYVQDQIKTNAWQFDLGVNLVAFETKDRNYFGVEPRLGITYTLSKNTSMLFSYQNNQQFLHNLSLDYTSTTTNILVGSDYFKPPEKSSQQNFSMQHNINKHITVIGSIYNKTLTNLSLWSNHLILNNADAYITINNWKRFVNSYDEQSLGGEIEWRYQSNLLGFNTHYNIANINRSITTYTDQLQEVAFNTHQLSLGLTYSVSHNMAIHIQWLHKSGDPINRYAYNDIFLLDNLYPMKTYTTDREILKPYQRLDFSIQYHVTKSSGRHQVGLSIFNALNQRNETHGYRDNHTIQVVLSQAITPSLGYQYQWRQKTVAPTASW